ncbi:MAG: CDP-alcohol phosphatidyltransferase family protein [Putridiphycobacter sp.]
MISVYKIKPAFQKFLTPVLKHLRKLGVTPNHLTISAIFLSIFMGMALVFYNDYRFLLLCVAIGYLIRMMLNALDGMMATKFNLKSKLGEVLNETGDVISDVVIILPLMYIPNINKWIIIVFAILSVFNEFSGVLAKVISGTRHYEGPMGKSDRALLIGLFTLILYFWDNLSLYGNWVFGFAGFLVVISSVIRLKNGLNEVV